MAPLIIDLCGDDSPTNHLKSVRKRLSANEDDPNEPPDRKISSSSPEQGFATSSIKKVKLEPVHEEPEEDKKPAARPTMLKEDDDVEMVDASLMQNVMVTPSIQSPPFANAKNHNDNEVTMVGTKNQIRLPHMRQHCTLFPFRPSHAYSVSQSNEDHCDMCYCYICDVPVPECKNWKSHCQARDSGQLGHHYRALRLQEARSKQTTGVPTPQPSITSPQFNSTNPIYEECKVCQYCEGVNGDSRSRLRTVAFCFCNTCGRLVSKDYHATVHAEAKLPPEAVDLGKKTIGYRLLPNCPQTNKQAYWDMASLGPAFIPPNETIEANDTYAFLLGERPDIGTLLQAISPLPEDQIEKKSSERIAIILEDLKQVNMLSSLYNVNQKFGVNDYLHCSSPLEGSISTTFDPESLTGTISVQVFLCIGRQTSFERRERHDAMVNTALYFTGFLGHWFGVLPFQLGGESESPPNPPFKCQITRLQCEESEVAELEKLAEHHNAQIDTMLQSRYTLTSPDGNYARGGICPASRDFQSFIHNFFREASYDISAIPSTPKRLNGEAHQHRTLRSTWSPGTITKNPFHCFLSPRDTMCLDAMDDPQNVVSSIDTLMNHLTNRGHEAAPFVEGLTVELLPFQQQSLQWTFERETLPGGIQTELWPKLPLEGDKVVYFNPILGKTSLQEPRLVRGGILAEQMGLGKTVISLALILKNPAPALPPSGSPSTDISKDPDHDHSFWDPAVDAGEGTIVSRGTLVVCNVSLVGQWIAEAKSKLKNPGLVYSYHGSNRVRNPAVLAKNSIVVTTYETLQSDDVYHRKRSDDPDKYVPPCAKIRWWRIICDEGHIMRSCVHKLLGDHKWTVSGTPISTSIMDVKYQLEFLGVQDVNDYMKAFKASAFQRVKDRNRAGLKRANRGLNFSNDIGPFTFFMRSLLMRHTQTQKYVGTNTTLMSLPKKTEREVIVAFNATDRSEYKRLEQQSKDTYLASVARMVVSKNYLFFHQMMTPLRIACSGGPLYKKQESDNGEQENDNSKVSHIYTSKLNMLITELTTVRQSDPTAKSLVFSQFKSTLKWLKAELPKHGFTFRSLSGDMTMAARSKALRDFQNDPPTTIFLLSMRAGAVGINLTQANRVFIMEPCFNPAVEAQAIGRVHRLGQTRPVEIIRLLMEDSIETRMRKVIKNKYGSGTGMENVAEVGSIATDKAEVVREEFDALMGVTPTSPVALAPVTSAEVSI